MRLIASSVLVSIENLVVKQTIHEQRANLVVIVKCLDNPLISISSSLQFLASACLWKSAHAISHANPEKNIHG